MIETDQIPAAMDLDAKRFQDLLGIMENDRIPDGLVADDRHAYFHRLTMPGSPFAHAEDRPRQGRAVFILESPHEGPDSYAQRQKLAHVLTGYGVGQFLVVYLFNLKEGNGLRAWEGPDAASWDRDAILAAAVRWSQTTPTGRLVPGRVILAYGKPPMERRTPWHDADKRVDQILAKLGNPCWGMTKRGGERFGAAILDAKVDLFRQSLELNGLARNRPAVSVAPARRC